MADQASSLQMGRVAELRIIVCKHTFIPVAFIVGKREGTSKNP